ncbi:BMP family ABC transporter substrate-binding protein [Mycoplasma sp. Pen4]|uniref:BMP family ABC transporter substrate-binding protein n=1 Tax=Mycoplasma sp. Pen4 TaxID=640330 RepID=UPI001654345C|nr:BMP family ABC transporter substrate-binding protein [Mycoplasma sp. Pen4]QNM93530.1 BMP family ABC transporter substrate-binding protein [Mycoplasma sp. Pen4]
MKLKKFLLGSMPVLAASSLFAASAGCSSTEEKNTNNPETPAPGTGATDPNKDLPYYVAPNDRIANIRKDDSVSVSSIQEGQTLPTVTVVSETGKMLDKSFNQSSMETLWTLREQLGNKLDVTGVESTTQNLNSTYEALLSKPANQVWVLSGFGHGSVIESFIPQHLEELKAKNVKIIVIDAGLSSNASQDVKNYSDLYFLTYKVNQSAYIVGQAINNFLKDKPEAERSTYVFGGGPYDGVTDFIVGYLKGIYTAGKNIEIKTDDGKVNLDSGFQADDKMNAAIAKMLSTHAKIDLPVAGTATSLLVDKLETTKDNSTKIIGVDVNQAAAFKSNADKFITSITKNISQSVYDTLLYILFRKDEKDIFVTKEEGKVFDHAGTFKEDWVGYAPSTLGDEADKAAMNTALENAKTAFLALTGDNLTYVDNRKVMPTSETEAPNVQELIAGIVAQINAK